MLQGVLYATHTVHLIPLHQQMKWIGSAQGPWFLMIKVHLKLFAGVCLQLILLATVGSVKSKHHKNITHGTAEPFSFGIRIRFGVDESHIVF